jgi:hypothetical protein
VAAGVAVIAAAACVGAYAAYVSASVNGGDSFASGSVALSDNDSGTAMFTTLTSASPGDSATNCIRVLYTGTLTSAVHLYGTVGGSLAPYVTLTVTRGTDPSPSFGSCSTFVADATNYTGNGPGVVYSGTLSGYPSTYAGGLVDPQTWSQNDAHIYKFAISVGSSTAGQGQSATASFTWEARNQ